MTDKCKTCNTELEWMGGCSAHLTNRYCPNSSCPTNLTDPTMSQFASKEDYYRAQFERDYCDAFNLPCNATRILFRVDDVGNYAELKVFVSYQLWKRAKLEVRTVQVDWKYMSAPERERIKSELLKKANIKVEFV